eukprot:m.196883 g.196883  ORF g.196883 m.196883 type:complete len:425 (-) comp18702_c0_seq19:271-1545(-)
MSSHELVRKIYLNSSTMAHPTIYSNPFLVFVVAWIISTVGSVRIGAFNIRTFGVSKMSNAPVADIIARIIRRYDILVVQEVRDASGTATADLLNLVNSFSTTPDYDVVVSDRFGIRGSSYQEAYAWYFKNETISEVQQFVWESSTISTNFDECINSGNPPMDTFPRQCFDPVANTTFTEGAPQGSTASQLLFYARSPHGVQWSMANPYDGNNVSFVTIGFHSDPDNVTTELNALALAAKNVSRQGLGVFVMGDFNADCGYLLAPTLSCIETQTCPNPELALAAPEFTWYIPNSADTTTGATECAYDRLLGFDPLLQQFDVANATVFLFNTTFSLNDTQAAAVSDHFPVEAVLNPRESYWKRYGLSVAGRLLRRMQDTCACVVARVCLCVFVCLYLCVCGRARVFMCLCLCLCVCASVYTCVRMG